MNFIKLVINELIKIIKKKSTIIFVILAIISIVLSCFLVNIKNNFYKDAVTYTKITDEYNINLNIARLEGLLKKEKNESEKKSIEKNLEIYNFVLKEGIDKIYNAEYKMTVHTLLKSNIKKLCYMNENENKEKYKKQKENVEKLWEIFTNGTFEEYIEFNKDLTNQSFNAKEITLEEYNLQIENQNQLLKYEITKYMPQNTEWKKEILENNTDIDDLINTRFDISSGTYIDDEELNDLKNQKIINEYRLENNIAPYYNNFQANYNQISYNRYTYNDFANKLSTIFIGILIIIFSSSTISEEISKGTIKFLLITPYKRYKILFAKIISMLIVLIICLLLISQISVLVGNIAFGNNTNNYLYVSNGVVNIMGTHLYETIQYILRIPELFIYLLIGIMFSTLTRNTAISTVITSILFIGAPVAIDKIYNFIKIDSLKYLPFSNFNLIDSVLKLEKYDSLYKEVFSFLPPIQLSIIVLSITALLLIITALESFNKKDI